MWIHILFTVICTMVNSNLLLQLITFHCTVHELFCLLLVVWLEIFYFLDC